MADFRSPFVPGPAALHRRRGRLPRLRRGVVVRAGAGRSRRRPPTAPTRPGFMLFDTVLAFDHVQHRILHHRQRAHHGRRRPRVAVPVRVREDSVPRARARAQPVARAPRTAPAALEVRSNHTRERVRSSRCATAKEHIAAGDIYQVVLSQRFEADVDGRSVHRLPRAAAREPVALHVLHPHGRRVDRRLVARDAGARRRVARRDASDRGHAAARPQRRRGHAAGRGAEAQREGARRARDARRSRPQRRRPRLRVRHRCACRSSWGSSASRTSCT